jgi:hypothetical protein
MIVDNLLWITGFVKLLVKYSSKISSMFFKIGYNISDLVDKHECFFFEFDEFGITLFVVVLLLGVILNQSVSIEVGNVTYILII